MRKIPRRKTTKAQRERQAKYQKKLSRFVVSCNPENEEDLKVIEKLKSEKSYSNYIKDLIIKDLQK